jgi:hypothetical protein
MREGDGGDLHGLLRRLTAASVLGLGADEAGALLPLLGFGSMERNGTGLLNFGALNKIAMAVQERHSGMSHFKKSKTFQDFLTATCGHCNRQGLHFEHVAQLGSPTVEVALVEYRFWCDTDGRSLVPRHHEQVITSVATAGSGEMGEWNVFFNMVDPTLRDSLFGPSFATVLRATQLTGRDPGHPPHASLVKIGYNDELQVHQFAAESEHLFQELVQRSERNTEAKHSVKGTVDSIFHYGCISHYETPAPDGEHNVEGWARHEHWNILYCMAMARHALEFLRVGGTLVLKVRVFENLETLGIVSVLSCAFEQVYLYANPRMQAEFVAFVGVGFLGPGKALELVKRVMAASASYSACDIFDPAIVGLPKFMATLKRAHEVREEMRRDHDRVTLVLLQVMALVHARKPFEFIEAFLPPRLAEMNCELPRQGGPRSQRRGAPPSELPVEIDSGWSADLVRLVDECIAELDTAERRDDKVALARFVRRFKVGQLMPP